MVVTGGVDTLNDIFMHMCFSKTHTLSATGDARPFSKDADGTVLGEGIGILVLKRLNQAQKDGHRIYAIIKGLGSSSDGKSQSIYSPSIEGQIKALRSAYKNAGINPATVDLIEAHGTGTRVGDKVEFKALNRIFQEAGANGHKCALGSVKSMIGHTKASAGAAGLIKAALSLYHKVLPPTLKATAPDPDLNIENSHFYLNSTARPWFSGSRHPRRAGVSAFGFGGSNFHIVLEESQPAKTAISWDGEIDIIALSAADKDGLIRKVKTYRDDVTDDFSGERLKLKAAESRKNFSSNHSHRLLMLQEDSLQRSDLFERALSALDSPDRHDWSNLENIFIGGSEKPGKLAFVFPGQGSQYVEMGRDIACTFPQAMKILEEANEKFHGQQLLTDHIYPPRAHTTDERQKQEATLRRTEIAQPAIGAVSLAMLKILQKFAIKPDATCGHSFGELTALCAAGWIDESALMELAIARGRLMAAAGQDAQSSPGAMLAVKAPLDELEALVNNSAQNVILANRNSPTQGVLSGTESAINNIDKICRTKNFHTIRLPVSTAFHSNLVEGAARPFRDVLNKVAINPTQVQVFSNTSAKTYPSDPDDVRALLGNQLAQPVDFLGEIEGLFNAGVRTFVEIGPKSVLTGLISATLQGRDFSAMSLDATITGGNGVADLARLLCRLAAIGYPLALTDWEKPIGSVRQSRMNIPLSGTNYREQKQDCGCENLQKAVQGEKRLKNRRRSGADVAPKKRRISQQAFSNYGNQRARRDYRHPSAATNAHDFRHTKSMEKKTASNQPLETDQLRQLKPIDTDKVIMSKNDINQSELIQNALKVVTQGLQSMQNLQTETARAHQRFLESQAEANRTLQEMMKSTQRLTEKSLGISVEPFKPAAIFQHPSKPAVESRQQDISFQEDVAPTGQTDNAGEPGVGENLSVTKKFVSSPAPSELHQGAANGYAHDPVTDSPQSDKSEPAFSDQKSIETAMLEVVSRLTGYPVEMLGLDMDIEAELGIDSIKRVEILSALEEQIPDLPAVSPETMGSLKTLGQIVDYFLESNNGQTPISRADDPIEEQHHMTEETASPTSGDSQNQIIATMLEVVGQLTGYPVEMLGLDMDIEAELGIDSIKRVEILSAMEERMPDLPKVSPEIMGTLKTLGQIIEYLGSASTPASAQKPSGDTQLKPITTAADSGPVSADPSGQVTPESNGIEIPRHVIKLKKAPENSGLPLQIPGNKMILVSEDNTGLSDKIIQKLSETGLNSAKINLAEKQPNNLFPKAAGLIIVQDPNSNTMEQDLKDAFALTKHLAPHLLQAADNGVALFATISRLDGAFGFRGKDKIHPIQGGLAGLAKTAAVEWQNICCHAVDVDMDCPDLDKMGSMVVEAVLTPGPVEIGLDSECRWSLALEPEPYPDGPIYLDSKDVVIISGGARGITAAAARSLAEHARSCLVLLGRSPNPVTEPAWLSSLEDEASMKKAILANEFHGKTTSPVKIEKAYKNYMTNREISRNLSAIKAAGSAVHYYPVDIRDHEAVSVVVDAVRRDHGPITGIIHGAGVLEDRLIVDKTVEQFEHVFDTKVKGLKNLLAATNRDSLKYLLIFSSVAARFGNAGQVDYAMANEALNKIAQVESSRKEGCQVKAINWGPWDGGMVTPGLKRQFENRGIDLIPVPQGIECMLNEMRAAQDSAVEIVIGAGFADRREITRPSLVKSLPAVDQHQLTLCFEREIDMVQYPVLNSHIIDEKPVVPLALIMEWFAHGALHQNPGLMLHGLDNIRVLKGIRLEHDKYRVRLFADKLKKSNDFYEVPVELRGGWKAGQDLIHARARAILSDHTVPPPPYQFSKAMIAGAYTKNIDDVYEEILFHGIQLRGIRKIVSCSSRGMVAQISSAPAPREWISSPFRDQWISDPLVLDCAFQMAILWCFEEKETLSLPTGLTSYRQHCRQFPAEGITAVLEVSEVTNHKIVGNFTFSDSNGDIVAQLKGYQAISKASLLKSFKPQHRALA
ncbi:MAG: SDR family oxidoreductase [Desulfobacterales bacterium]|jgi:acyl transferase domain-containing protein/NAD(P)-dependent dehydrogenase (short-subunit alcohol dehydrogenase family)/acyl carrier protein